VLSYGAPARKRSKPLKKCLLEHFADCAQRGCFLLLSLVVYVQTKNQEVECAQGRVQERGDGAFGPSVPRAKKMPRWNALLIARSEALTSPLCLSNMYDKKWENSLRQALDKARPLSARNVGSFLSRNSQNPKTWAQILSR
jgi:hypothetical protein